MITVSIGVEVDSTQNKETQEKAAHSQQDGSQL